MLQIPDGFILIHSFLTSDVTKSLSDKGRFLATSVLPKFGYLEGNLHQWF